MTDRDRIQAILHYWFDELDTLGMCPQAQNKLWFQSRPETDREIEQRFGADVRQALAGELNHWVDEKEGLIALVILLDQFTRNIYRGTAAAFSGDRQALAMAATAVACGTDRKLASIHRVFLYIPYEHAEDLATQEAGIGCFDRLLEDCHPDAGERVSGFRDYSVAHRDVIARFGRFPHRNAILGRESTGEEVSHLEQHGGF
jgi:uncharacterized protein (DUF924 family)